MKKSRRIEWVKQKFIFFVTEIEFFSYFICDPIRSKSRIEAKKNCDYVDNLINVRLFHQGLIEIYWTYLAADKYGIQFGIQKFLIKLTTKYVSGFYLLQIFFTLETKFCNC